MNKKEVSIAFQTNKTAAEYIALAKLVNQYSFDVVSVYCDYPFHPSYSPLTIMAPHIKKARMGPAAVSPYRINPLDIAANTALLSDIAPGGAYVGLARGAWLSEHGSTEPSAPIRGIREAIQIIQNLLSGNPVGIAGNVFNISQHVHAAYPLPNQPIPVLVGTWGEKLATVAGELADEVKIGGSANPLMIAHLQSPISAGEKIAGREPGSVGIVVGAVTVVDLDRELARAKARREVALYLPVVAPLDRTIQVDPELITQLKSLAVSGDYDQAGSLISDALLDQFALSGSPVDIIAQSLALYEAGAVRVEFGTPHGINPSEGINLLGSKVLPEIRKTF